MAKNTATTCTTVLLVRGTDYAALMMEQKFGVEKAAKLVRAGKSLGQDIEGEIFEFGAVDPKFIEFLYDKGLIDYDNAKHANFYVLSD